MNYIIETITSHFTYVALTTLTTFLTWLITKAKYGAKSAVKEAIAQREATRKLIHIEVETAYQKHKQNKILEPREYHKVASLYHNYKIMGGNGVVDRMAQEMGIAEQGGTD